MGTATKPTRENRTITVDFRDEATYFCLIADGKAFLEFVFAFLLSLGFQLKHKATCHGGGRLTRHSHYARIGFDHGAGHPRLFLDDAKAPNCQKNNGFGDLGNYSEWPKVAGAVIQAQSCSLRIRNMRDKNHGALDFAGLRCATQCVVWF